MAYTLLEISYTLVVCFLLYFFISSSYKGQFLLKKPFLHWIIFGFLINLYGLSWLYTVYPLAWIPEGPVQLLGIGLLHMILSLCTSLGYFVVVYAFHKKIPIHLRPTAIGVALVSAEIIRSLVISLLYLGDKTTVALHFTAGTIGNALSTTPFIEFAYFGGTFGLTFVLGYIIYCLQSFKTIQLYKYHALGLFVIFLSVHFFIPVSLPNKEVTVGIISTDFKTPQKDDVELYKKTFRENFPILDRATFSLASSSPMFIVYPEDARYLSHLSVNDLQTLSKVFAKTLFVDGDTLKTKEGFSNVSIFYSPTASKPIARGKELLLPFNEYLPYLFRSMFQIFIEKDAVDAYTRNHSYTPIYSKKTILFDDIRIGTLICSEILSYSLLNRLHKEDADIVFFQSHLSVFHNNPWFIMHMRSFTKVAAAQLRTTIITSSNGSPSMVVSPHGKILTFTKAGFATSVYKVPAHTSSRDR